MPRANCCLAKPRRANVAATSSVVMCGMGLSSTRWSPYRLSRRVRATCPLALVAVCLVSPLLTRGDNRSRALTCKQYSYALDAFSSGETAIAAPDNRVRVLLAKDFTFQVLTGDRAVGEIRLKDMSSNIGVVWSPDSRKFLISYSDGGAIGGFHVHIYRVRTDSVKEMSEPPVMAFKDFENRYYCKTRGDNIEGIGWTSNSAAVFFIASVYPTSDCAPIWDKALGYLVSLNGEIIRRYTRSEARVIRASCKKRGRALLTDSEGRASH